MKILVTLLLCFGCCLAPVQAEMLIGSVEYQSVDGKIGVRVSNHGKVMRVHAGSPAQIAGIREGDVITTVDGMKDNITSIHGMPGTLVSLTVKRSGVLETFSVDVPRIDYRSILANM